VPTGCCVVTEAGRLPSSFIIHAIGPKYSKYDKAKAENLLSSCIINTLEMAKLIKVNKVSIPSISSGNLGFPKDECAKIIINRVIQWFGY